MMETIIDFKKIEGPVYTGRDRGERLREQLKLDELDGIDASVDVRIPEDTYSISSSFFLGLFGPSVIRFGNRDLFYKKYRFEAAPFMLGIVDGHVLRALQERNLFG